MGRGGDGVSSRVVLSFQNDGTDANATRLWLTLICIVSDIEVVGNNVFEFVTFVLSFKAVDDEMRK